MPFSSSLSTNSVNRLSMMTRSVKRRELLRANRTTITASAAAVAGRKSRTSLARSRRARERRATYTATRPTVSKFVEFRLSFTTRKGRERRQPLDVGSGGGGRHCVVICTFWRLCVLLLRDNEDPEPDRRCCCPGKIPVYVCPSGIPRLGMTARCARIGIPGKIARDRQRTDGSCFQGYWLYLMWR